MGVYFERDSPQTKRLFEINIIGTSYMVFLQFNFERTEINATTKEKNSFFVYW